MSIPKSCEVSVTLCRWPDNRKYSLTISKPSLETITSTSDKHDTIREVRRVRNNCMDVEISFDGTKPLRTLRSRLWPFHRPPNEWDGILVDGSPAVRDDHSWMTLTPAFPDFDPFDQTSVESFERGVLRQLEQTIKQQAICPRWYVKGCNGRDGNPARLRYGSRDPSRKPDLEQPWRPRGQEGGDGVEKRWDEPDGNGYTIVRTWRGDSM